MFQATVTRTRRFSDSLRESKASMPVDEFYDRKTIGLPKEQRTLLLLVLWTDCRSQLTIQQLLPCR